MRRRLPQRTNARQPTLNFRPSPWEPCPEAADKERPKASISATSVDALSRAVESPIVSRDASSTPPASHLSASLFPPATLVMESSYELPDSTDWLPTLLPVFEPLEAALRCEICKEFYNNPVITPCAHTFCSLCIRRCIATDGRCPACKTACQADKLQPNIAVREISTRFQDARPKALELARARKQDDDETESLLNGRKRKRGKADGEGEGRRATRSQQKRRTQRVEDDVDMADDTPVIIADSDEEKEDEYVPDGMVPCPICKKPMKEEAVFNHIPVCPAAQEDDGMRKTRSRKHHAFPNTLQSREKESGPPPTRLSGLHYPMMNEKTLRKKLQDLGIPTWGTKPVMIKRHQEWLNLYNANCDASDDVRRTKRELLKELEAWERTQGGSATTKESHVMRKDFDGHNHATEHKSQFDALIANAKARAKAAAKSKEIKGNAEPTHSENVGTDAVHPPSPQLNNITNSSASPRPYENNETALSTIRQKVEEANRTDSVFPSVSHATEAANLKAGQEAHHDDVALGFAGSPQESLGSPTRKIPMFRMPEEPVVDVESSTAIQ